MIPLILDDVDLDSNYYWQDYRRIAYKGKFGFLNTTTGVWFIEPTFKNTLPSSSPVTWVEDENGWHCINQHKKTLTNQPFTQAHWVIPGELAAAELNKGVVLVNQEGKILTSVYYDAIYKANDRVSVVMKNRKYGYIDINGNQIVDPIYEKATYFQRGRGMVYGKYAYWFIDRSGRETLDRLKPHTLLLLFFGGLLVFFSIYRLKKRYCRIESKEVIETT